MDENERIAFVWAVYQLGLGRDPETPAAASGWATSIKPDGSNKWQVAQSILHSPEAVHYRATMAVLRQNAEAQAATLKALANLA